MTTGVDILKIYDRQIDQAYTDFESKEQKSSRLKVAMINVIERIYRGLDSQKDYDDIRPAIVYEKSFPLFSGSLRLQPSQIFSVTIVEQTPGVNIVTTTFASEHGFTSDDLANLVFLNIENSGLPSEVFAGPYAIASDFSLTSITASPVSVAYVQNSVSVYSTLTTVGNYMHLLAVRPQYNVPLDKLKVKIESITGNRIVFLFPTMLRTGQKIRITVQPGIALYEQDYYIKQEGKRAISLYLDEDLSTPASLASIPSSSTYLFSIIYSEYAEKISPHEFVSKFMGSEPWTPSYLLADGELKFRPSKPQPNRAYLTYLKSDLVFFDVESSSFDYETLYSRKFIQRVIDGAASDFNRNVRDYNALGAENNQILTNP